MPLVGQGTVLRHCGSHKITTWTNTISFSNTTSTTGSAPYTTAGADMSINNASYMNEVQSWTAEAPSSMSCQTCSAVLIPPQATKTNSFPNSVRASLTIWSV